MRLSLLVLVAATGCEAVRDAVHEATAPEVAVEQTPPAREPQAVAEPKAAPDDGTQKGIHVGDENGVHVGRDGEERGVKVGGDNGVVVGDEEVVKGVRVGGDKGVLVGKDDTTTGVRVGGEKGVEVGKGGISIGGKTIIGKKKEEKK